ncbi:MAG TPA: hypothetical protein VJZ49_04575 [Syntrophales bacterium]|nr:hypothetical protein [Syntrophales bacterium]
MIIEALKEIQKQNCLTDRQMGAKLDIAEKSWSRLKNGRSSPVLKTIRHALRSYPEIIEPVLCDICGDDYLEVVWPIIRRVIAGQIEQDKKEKAAAGK